MTNQQKQQTILKLAQLNRAMRHVLRQRCVTKSAADFTSDGDRTWSGFLSNLFGGNVPRYQPGSSAEKADEARRRAWQRDYVNSAQGQAGIRRFDSLTNQGRFRNPNATAGTSARNRHMETESENTNPTKPVRPYNGQ